MDQHRIPFGEKTQLLGKLATDMDPVLGRDFHEIDVLGRIGHELVRNRTAQAESGALHRVPPGFV